MSSFYFISINYENDEYIIFIKDNDDLLYFKMNVIFYENSLIIDKFVKLMNIPIKYWKKFFNYRKINIFNSYKIKGSINQKILLKLLVLFS